MFYLNEIEAKAEEENSPRGSGASRDRVPRLAIACRQDLMCVETAFSATGLHDGTTSNCLLSHCCQRREVVEVTPEFTSVTNSRERFVVVAMSALLLLISCTLFAVLFTLLSDDRTSTKSKEAIYAACRAFSFARGWSIYDI
ncbi:hypothetical protein MRX96_017846 [Rhipicephalus microplus]